MSDDSNRSDDNGAQGAAPAQSQAGAQQGPSINVLGQYIKDLSFENPRAPQSFSTQREGSPPLNVTVNVNAKTMGEDFEVELHLEARAGSGDSVLFNIELVYAGLFRVRNIPQDQVSPFVLIECPRLLFPFARQIIAETISSGGFPPLMLDPIDFVGLYRQRASEAQDAPRAQA